ncbi:NADP-dependent oxidoreductase [Pseudoduganella plicata]|uniref:NADP-dependent oxidoreductase n=1 Tax=Pseudoduganella plicata TaxID=321984 RepID=A0A4P7B9J3_9BURK|nr:NADP-dependent oxidoreductase [Pseudoduganella plicata]QBQ35196.1 NADP-dependent oxidoreductase [Pseudoduganella plicata]GGZ05153.1 NADP-dependent oxidoreductase [Pseudoduganella plicata]
MTTFQRMVLASRPQAEVTPDNFRLETADVPALADGQVLVRNHFLSLDPYMRGRMSEAKSYAAPQPLDETMIGGTVGQVVESKHPKFAEGDFVVGMGGWTEMSVSDGSDMRKVDTTHIPLSAYLGPVGMPGMTAWYGLTQIMQAKQGETICVSAASGAVGSVVGQLAKLRGCRAIGIAGGKEKCDYVVNELGFDACIDYKAGNLRADLKAAAPNGIDAIFENVGGEVFDAALARTNAFARIALCGMIAGYNGEDIPLRNVRQLLTNRISLRGFIVSEHMELWPEGLKELGMLVAQGKLKFRESVADGLAAAPDAFIGLLKGRNFGKQLVKLA